MIKTGDARLKEIAAGMFPPVEDNRQYLMVLSSLTEVRNVERARCAEVAKRIGTDGSSRNHGHCATQIAAAILAGEMAHTQVCNECGIEKPLGEYHRNRLGFWKTCKPCKAVRHRAWLANGGREIVGKNTREWRKRTGYPGWSDPKRQHARNVAQSAVRHGKLAKQPCEVCGGMRVEMHHEDYSKPLEVRFLCRKHHAVLHLKEQARGQREDG